MKNFFWKCYQFLGQHYLIYWKCRKLRPLYARKILRLKRERERLLKFTLTPMWRVGDGKIEGLE